MPLVPARPVLCHLVEDNPIISVGSWADKIDYKLGSGDQVDSPSSSQGTGDQNLLLAQASPLGVEMGIVEQISTCSETSTIPQDLAMEIWHQVSL